MADNETCRHCEGRGYSIDDERSRIPCEPCSETGIHIPCVDCGEQVEPFYADDHEHRCCDCAANAEERSYRDHVRAHSVGAW
jgi:hypothetical protein